MVSFQHITTDHDMKLLATEQNTTDVGQLLMKRASLLILWASSLELLHNLTKKYSNGAPKLALELQISRDLTCTTNYPAVDVAIRHC